MKQNKEYIQLIYTNKTFAMDCHTGITSLANTIKKWHNGSDFYSSYIHKLYNDKQEIIAELFFNTLKPYKNMLIILH